MKSKIALVIFYLNIFYISLTHGSVYFSQEALKEGITRGQSEEFDFVGTIIFDLNDGQSSAAFVGVLISPTKILTISHDLVENSKKGRAYFQLQLKNSVNQDLIPIDLSLTSICPLLDSTPKEFDCIDTKYSNEKNRRVKRTNNQFGQLADLAILTLKTPIHAISNFPHLMLTKPVKKWSNSYLISTNIPMLFGTPMLSTKNLYLDHLRHVGIVKLSALPDSTNIFSSWNIHDESHKSEHLLHMIPRPGDSGAPLLVKTGDKLEIAALFSRGTFSFNKDDEYGASFYIPLYPYASWLIEELKLH